MIADAPHPPAKPAVIVHAGITKRPIYPKGCRITFSVVTPAARRMGFAEIVTFWCSK